jgi:hypothetical protein
MSLEGMSKEELLDLVKEAVSSSVAVHPLSAEEIHWVRLAIEAEAKRAQLRDAIIQKTLAGLVWFIVVGAVVILWDAAVAAIHSHKV